MIKKITAILMGLSAVWAINATAAAITTNDLGYAVLKKSVSFNSKSPVFAKVASGKYKDATLRGYVVVDKADPHRKYIAFDLIQTTDAKKPQAINAIAIDPSTAKTMFKSKVDKDYVVKNSRIFGVSMLQSYTQGNAKINPGATIAVLFLK